MARRKADDEASIEQALAALDELPADRDARAAPLTAALAHKHYRVVAKAARLAADALLYDLVPPLRAAYARFLDKPVKTDPNCYAKKAVVRALVALDCDDVELFLTGLGLAQMEPVWGGQADTAADVRASCAMGLVGSGYPRALVAIVPLLYDPEPDARVGGVRAAAYGTPREAEILLRAKILSGDSEPAIVGECFTALLAVAPEESLPFVAPYLEHADDALRDLAALALGESRAPRALELLQAAWQNAIVADDRKAQLIRAAAAHRSEAAFDWLLALASEVSKPLAEELIEALALYKHNERLRDRLAGVLDERHDGSLEGLFAKLWKV